MNEALVFIFIALLICIALLIRAINLLRDIERTVRIRSAEITFFRELNQSAMTKREKEFGEMIENAMIQLRVYGSRRD